MITRLIGIDRLIIIVIIIIKVQLRKNLLDVRYHAAALARGMRARLHSAAAFRCFSLGGLQPHKPPLSIRPCFVAVRKSLASWYATCLVSYIRILEGRSRRAIIRNKM